MPGVPEGFYGRSLVSSKLPYFLRKDTTFRQNVSEPLQISMSKSSALCRSKYRGFLPKKIKCLILLSIRPKRQVPNRVRNTAPRSRKSARNPSRACGQQLRKYLIERSTRPPRSGQIEAQNTAPSSRNQRETLRARV